MPLVIPTGSVITEAMVTDWMSRFGRTRDQAIGDLDNIESGREELPNVVATNSTYAALVTAYHASVQKSTRPGRPSTLTAVVAAAAAVVAAIFTTLTATGVITSYTRVVAPVIQATSTQALAIMSAGGISASSTIQSLGTVTSTNLQVSNVATSTYFRAGTDGTFDTPAIGWQTGEGLTKSGTGSLALIGGGQYLMNLQTTGNSSYVSMLPASVGLNLGSLASSWQHGFFSGQVSSTSLIASATGTVGYLSVGNGYDTSQQASLMIKHTPTQSEATQRLPFLALWNTSSTLGTPLVFLDDDATNYIASITAYGDTAPFNGDFGFAPANMVMFESTSGTIMTAGDAVAVLSASGAFRPITGLGFGNTESLDPFGASASTTITNGNMASASLDFPNSAAAGTQDLTITVNGATDGDECQLGVPNALASRASEAFTCFVSAANTITVRRTCVAAGCGDPGAATVKAGYFTRQ